MNDKENEMNHITAGLTQMGWNSSWSEKLDALKGDLSRVARVVGSSRGFLRVNDGQRQWLVTPAGRLINKSEEDYPVVGDWVLTQDDLATTVLPRVNSLRRGAAGAHNRRDNRPNRVQVIAANLDAVFIVCGLDRDFNLRRIERYLTLVYNCGLNPVVVLPKADLHTDPTSFVDEISTVAFDVPVHLVAADNPAGLVSLERYLAPGQTVTLVGSSGAGKSTLLNRLYGQPVQTTAAVSEQVGKGRHTTTTRDLISMPQGGMIIDNPGVREVAFWDTEDGVETTFPDIEALTAGCRFSDCSHVHEPGCNVLAAVADGQLEAGRLESYHKMQRELEHLAARRAKSADRVEKERWKDVAMKIKTMKKGR